MHLLTLILAACTLLVAGAGRADNLTHRPVLPQDEGPPHAERLTTPERLEGRSVQTERGEEIGRVETLVLDPRAGRIAYLIVDSGERIIIPWKAVDITDRLESLEQERWQHQPGLKPGIEGDTGPERTGEPVLVVRGDRELLRDAPRSLPGNREQEARVHRLFGVAPYWE